MTGGALAKVLEDGRDLGFLGPGPVEPHIRHAETLADLLSRRSGRFIDLGSGAGVPGLVLALAWPDTHAVLIDSAQRRCEFLAEATDRLGLAERVVVRCGRAEDLARAPELRDACELVVARSFGAPAVVAECGVGFLAPAGTLVVTEPPPHDIAPDAASAAAPPERWPPAGLARLGLVLTAELRQGEVGVVVLGKDGPTDARWPRRSGVPRKRPLW